MKIRAIVQARMLSKRLRGKSLIAIDGIPLLYRVVNYIKKFEFIDEITIATTRAEADDPIAAAANNLGVGIYRGDSVNVLKRYRDASADMDEEDIIIRFTADNPVYNISIAKKAFNILIGGNYDYLHIDGLSHVVPEFIKVRALREMFSLVEDDFDFEHVTPYLRKNKKMFKVKTLPGNFENLRDDLDRYFTVDTQTDLDRLERMFQNVHTKEHDCDIDYYYEWIDNNYRRLDTHPDKKTIKLGNVLVGDTRPTFIIAEIGQNHNGSVELAKKLIDMAVRCGASAVKFQKRDIPSELTKKSFNQIYESSHSFGRIYGEHRMFLELNESEHKELKEYANAKGMIYFCTPCDIPSVRMMERIEVPFYKVASRDLTNIPTLEAIAKTEKPVIISTGMATLKDIDDALKTLGKERGDIIILQCTSQYPTDMERVNLRAMKSLKKKFGKMTGFSDHTPGIIASVAAATLGACVIEKHITLSRAMKGSDHAGSLEEVGLKKMIEYIRLVEKAMGDGIKEIDPATDGARIKLARSVTSNVDIRAGDILTEEMICLKSPGDGLLWRERNKIIGKKAIQDIPSDTTLLPKDFH